ncbi:MAG: preprotein translocase subunit SecE [Rikenella sp.]|nr:preprotein translocase subunit SecE [Rikenella sp.]
MSRALARTRKSPYDKEAYNELVHKVTWPSWTSLQNSAIVVMIASLILALVVLAMDISFETIMKGIYSILY